MCGLALMEKMPIVIITVAIRKMSIFVLQIGRAVAIWSTAKSSKKKIKRLRANRSCGEHTHGNVDRRTAKNASPKEKEIIKMEIWFVDWEDLSSAWSSKGKALEFLRSEAENRNAKMLVEEEWENSFLVMIIYEDDYIEHIDCCAYEIDCSPE
jgi:hypothetical protein